MAAHNAGVNTNGKTDRMVILVLLWHTPQIVQSIKAMQPREIIYCVCAALAASSPGPVHFGLGAETRALTVEITWPSGIVQKLENVNADRIVKVTENVTKNQQGSYWARAGSVCCCFASSCCTIPRSNTKRIVTRTKRPDNGICATAASSPRPAYSAAQLLIRFQPRYRSQNACSIQTACNRGTPSCSSPLCI
jgi:ASPIC and UnbV